MDTGIPTVEYPVTVNELTIETKPQKVAVLSGSLADVILAMGYETSLVLGSADCTQPELEVLAKVDATDASAVLAASPDLVLAEALDEGVLSALNAAGVPVLVLERATNRESFERLYAEVGTALDGSTTGYNNGIKAAQKIFSSLDDLARLAPDSDTIVTACYISDLSGAAVTGDELGSVMMSYMGLTNVFKGREGGTFTFDELSLSDPTMIFCTEEVREQIYADTAYAELTAVMTGRVYAVDPHYMQWQGRTVYEAAIDMMGLAYPELTEEGEASVTMEIPTPTPEPTPTPTP
ncbi:MAG: ABC transporter substrate-binding protein, partial [Clostridia bacterium]|nr:ABC transporter substrate-binding protein [Clostridia bacterium]